MGVLGVSHGTKLAEFKLHHGLLTGRRHPTAVLSWVIIQVDGREFARGIDQIQAGGDGRICKITTFAPSVKAESRRP